MKKIVIPFLMIALLLTGCSSYEDASKESIKQQVDNFYTNLLLEDLDKVMKQISTDSEQYYDLYDEYRSTFQNFNYSYQLKELSFNEVSKERSIVSVWVTVSGIDKSNHYDSYEMIQVFSFKSMNDNVWKINSLETKIDL